VELELSDDDLLIIPAMIANIIPPMISQKILDCFFGGAYCRGTWVTFGVGTTGNGTGACDFPQDWQKRTFSPTTEPQFWQYNIFLCEDNDAGEGSTILPPRYTRKQILLLQKHVDRRTFPAVLPTIVDPIQKTRQLCRR